MNGGLGAGWWLVAIFISRGWRLRRNIISTILMMMIVFFGLGGVCVLYRRCD
jgi:hypothetical protein